MGWGVLSSHCEGPSSGRRHLWVPTQVLEGGAGFNSQHSQMLIVKFDIAENYMLMFQDAASPTMIEIISFHHFVMIYLVFIITAVL